MISVMCKNLAELIQAEQPLFSIMVEQLERASGRPSIDVRLLAEVIGKVHLKTRALGLDPHDTTGPELYHALQDLVAKHDSFMAKRLGAKNDDVEDVLSKVKPFVDNLAIPKSAWVMKYSAAKRLLKQTPPRQLMKHLHYRSVDSMLKRESICEVFGSMRFVESQAWQKSFMRKYSTLSPMDFETREIEIINLEGEKWHGIVEGFVKNGRNNIAHVKELGVVMILPLPVEHLPGISITTLTKVLHSINEIRLYSSYFKLQQVSNQFGARLWSALLNDPDHVFVAGHKVHWRTMHGHFTKNSFVKHIELFEPHLQLEDLEWRKAEAVLYAIEPALYFWFDMDYVAAHRSSDSISFNLMDNALNYVNRLPYENRLAVHFNNSLINELMMRYIGEPPMENLIVKQLSLYTAHDQAEFAI